MSELTGKRAHLYDGEIKDKGMEAEKNIILNFLT